MSKFAHLHLHTQYSLLDGANKISEVVKRAAALGHPAIAMTDHGNLHGAIEFYSEAKKNNIKPIIGCEMYVAGESRLDRTKTSNYHLTCLAASPEGYKNLCRLTSLAFTEGFYFKPRVDHEILSRYSEGLILLSGCLSSELNGTVRSDDRRKAKELLEFYCKHFKDRFYLEVQPHALGEQNKLNEMCRELAAEFGLPLIATTDCHYGSKDDHYAQEILMCISTGKTVNDPDRMRHEGVELHLKSYEEMLEGFHGASWADEAIRNSVGLASRCNLAFDFNTYYMPQFPVEDGTTAIEVMARIAREGLEKRLQVLATRSSEYNDAEKNRYWERLEREIALIDKMGFAGYFLVVSDFIVWAKEHGVPVGPGRGSCAGSLVAYAMRITDVDPIANKLLFERFLNPDRISLPDIDVDFCINGRDKVIQYVCEKYGKDRVAQIATFGTLKAKAAIKDVGRALGLSYAETEKVAELIPAPRQGFDYPIAEAIKMEPRLAEYAEGQGKELISLAMKLEGLTRHSSTHAAGVVIADRPLVELLPMMRDKEGQDVTQFSMSYVEKIGLVKFDFLGLKTLTVLHTAVRIIEESRGLKIVLTELPLEDSRTYELLCAGNTTGVFQLESSGITEMTMRLKPNCFDDLVAILALYRPGPLDAGMVDHYINRKHGRAPVSYLHPLMKNVLADTYGIMIYQEQIMQLARDLAGYSLAEADLLRKAMGKKNPEEMKKQRDRFLSGADQNKIARKLAEEIFDQMETFARYGFNRSHSVAYALISFQTAYLKAHYPVEFMAALMSQEAGDSDKTLKNLNECRKQGVKVLPPDVNESSSGFTVRGEAVRYGLEAVKGIGEKAVQCIIEHRERAGPYQGLGDFASRVDLKAVNKRVFESLIKCGAFDFAKVSRRELLERLEDLLKIAQAMQREDNSNQMSLFGGNGSGGFKPTMPKMGGVVTEWPVNRKLSYEREALGFYISGHPLEKFKRELKKLGVPPLGDVRGKGKQSSVRFAGVVTGLRLKNTKKGDRYASFALEDYEGTVECLVWPDVYRQFSNLLVSEEPVIVTGRLDVTEERCNLIAEKIESLVVLRDKSATVGILNLSEEDTDVTRHERLMMILRRHPGSCPVRVQLGFEKEEVSVVLKDNSEGPVKVAPSETLSDEIEQLFGRPTLFYY